LASGDGYQTIALSYRIGISTTANLIKEICEAIWNCFYADVLLPLEMDDEKYFMNFKKYRIFPIISVL